MLLIICHSDIDVYGDVVTISIWHHHNNATTYHNDIVMIISSQMNIISTLVWCCYYGDDFFKKFNWLVGEKKKITKRYLAEKNQQTLAMFAVLACIKKIKIQICYIR